MRPARKLSTQYNYWIVEKLDTNQNTKYLQVHI